MGVLTTEGNGHRIVIHELLDAALASGAAAGRAGLLDIAPVATDALRAALARVDTIGPRTARSKQLRAAAQAPHRARAAPTVRRLQCAPPSSLWLREARSSLSLV